MYTRESTEVPISTVDLPAVDKGSEAFMCVHRIYKHGPNVQVGRLFAAFICAIQAHFYYWDGQNNTCNRSTIDRW